MPYASLQQARWAHATSQPFAERWDKLTDFSKLPKRVRVKLRQARQKDVSAAPAASGYAHGPGGLMSAPGLGGKREKAWSDAARAAALAKRRANAAARGHATGSSSGSSAGRLARSGRASGSASGGGKGGSKRSALDRFAGQLGRQAELLNNRSDVLNRMNIAPDGQRALEQLRAGESADPAAIARGGFVQAGLVEQAADGSYRLTASGRAALNAADRGDLGRAGDTISAARDRQTAREQRRQAVADRKRAAEQKRQAAAERRAELAKRRTASGGRASTSDPATEQGPEAGSGDAQQVLVDRLRGLLEQARARQARATEQAAKRGRGRSWARVIMPKRVRRKAHMMSRDEEKAMFANLAKSGKLRRKKPGTAAASGQKEEPKKEAPKGLHQAISEAEDKIRAQRHETAHVFSPNGESLFSNDGGKDYVDFSDAAIANIKGRNATLTHNHPGGWDYPKNDPRHAGNSFSLEDARMAVAADLAEIRAVTPTRTYSLRRPPSGWDGSKLERAYADVNRETRRTFTDRIQHGQMTIAEAEAQHTHTVWQQVAAAIGAGYSYEGT